MNIGTITRRKNYAFHKLHEEFQDFYDRVDFKRTIEKLKKAGDTSRRPTVLAELYRMFDGCGIKYERGRENAYYMKLVELSDLPSFQELEQRILYTLYSIYEEYPQPKAYMKRIVDRLSTDDEWKNDSLRLRILKQFIKYGNYLLDAGYGGEKSLKNYVKPAAGKKRVTKDDVLTYVDDAVFDLLKTANKYQKDADGKYGLLKLADDLGEGKFRTDGVTKKQLYLFAMVYGMTYYIGEVGDEVQIIHYETDIEKNLFEDYYTNNLMRFVSTSYREKKNAFEKEPSGQGINYKNFAEVVYLYFISKEYEPEEKIKRASQMINRLRENAKKQQILTGTAKRQRTAVFRNHIHSDNILSLSEAEFEEFISQNYHCDTGEKFGYMQLEREQETAYQQYQDILELIEETGVTLEEGQNEVWFGGNDYEDMRDSGRDIDKEKYEQFMELLSGVNSFLKYPIKKSAKDVTRTSLIVAYYYYNNCLYESMDAEQRMNEMKSFKKFYEEFKYGIEEFLEASFYQPLKGMDIFELFVIFSSYQYVRELDL